MAKRKVWGPGEGTEEVHIPGGKGPGKPEDVPGKYNLCVAEVTSLFTNSILAFQPQIPPNLPQRKISGSRIHELEDWQLCR